MSQNTPLFHSTWYIKGIRRWAVKNYAVFHIIMERSDNFEEVRWAAYFQEYLEKPGFHQVKGEVNEWDAQWLSLFPRSFLVIFWWRISCQLLIVWHLSHTVTLDNLSLQALGDAPGKLDQGVFQRFWWVRHLDSCCNLSCPPRICWG